MAARELFIGARDGTKHIVTGDTFRVLAPRNDTGGAFEVFEMIAPRDSGPPPHAHPWSESYSIVEGSVEVRIGDRTFSGQAGSFFQIPAGTFHSHRITSDSARMIVVTSPTGAADSRGSPPSPRWPGKRHSRPWGDRKKIPPPPARDSSCGTPRGEWRPGR